MAAEAENNNWQKLNTLVVDTFQRLFEVLLSGKVLNQENKQELNKFWRDLAVTDWKQRYEDLTQRISSELSKESTERDSGKIANLFNEQKSLLKDKQVIDTASTKKIVELFLKQDKENAPELKVDTKDEVRSVIVEVKQELGDREQQIGQIQRTSNDPHVQEQAKMQLDYLQTSSAQVSILDTYLNMQDRADQPIHSLADMLRSKEITSILAQSSEPKLEAQSILSQIVSPDDLKNISSAVNVARTWIRDEYKNLQQEHQAVWDLREKYPDHPETMMRTQVYNLKHELLGIQMSITESLHTLVGGLEKVLAPTQELEHELQR